VTQLFPNHFIGAAMLPQSPGVDISTCLPEMRKCISEYGFVGINLNPDPSGGHWRDPPLSHSQWHPIYEEMIALDVPALIHVSTSCNECFHSVGAHYLNADTTAFMQCLTSDLFAQFPDLRFVIPHGGGAVPYHWGRFRGLAKDMNIPDINQKLLNNIYFDTCVYHQPGINLLTEVIPVKNILFASETFGAVKGIDPDTGFYFDDTRRYLNAVDSLSKQEKAMIFEGNARKVFPRINNRIPK
jgi:4-oxalmesaconate hydratase